MFNRRSHINASADFECLDSIYFGRKSNEILGFYPVLAFYSLFFLAIPAFHLLSHRDLMQPALKVSLDSLSTIIGVFGMFTCGALSALNRRLAALEKAMNAEDHQS